MTSSPSCTIGGTITLAQRTRHQQLLEQYVEYLPVAQRLQLELFETIEQLQEVQYLNGKTEESVSETSARWDEVTVAGATAWAEDLGVSWRALRRARFRQDKASEVLLSTLTVRSLQSLHLALPLHLQAHIQRSPTPPIYTILPPQWYSDRIGRPVGVLTLRHIKRDVPSRSGETGKEGIREFAWWIAELTRRVLRDWYEGEYQESSGNRRGNVAGGGCVLVVDAKDAGMKNLELELLPNLISINHNYFPSQFSTVYVLNHSWTHSGLWACIKRVLPQSALEKIVFLKGEQQIGDVFDLERLPKAYGGKSNRDLDRDAMWLYETHGTATLSTARKSSGSPGKAGDQPSAHYVPSYESIADVFYSARNTPIHSTHASPAIRSRKGLGKQRPPRLNLTMTTNPSASQGLSFVPLKGYQSETTQAQSAARVKSISDFQLYLSPSRVTNLDLLLGSDEEASDEEALQLESLRARQRARRQSRSSLRSSITGSGLPSQRSRLSFDPSVEMDNHPANGERAPRPAITPWITGSGRAADSMRQASWNDARSYSASLTRHHAEVLIKNRRTSGLSTEVSPDVNGLAMADQQAQQNEPIDGDSEASTYEQTELEHGSDGHSTTAPTASTRSEETPHRRRVELPISAYDRMMNPMFGYPALQTVSTSGHNLAGMLRPRYGRKRKRDLAKTLLFLFLLRMDSFRRWIGQATTNLVASVLAMIGLGGLFKAQSDQSNQGGDQRTHGRRNPEQAFALARHGYASQGLGRSKIGDMAAAKGDWLWMVLTIVLVRGSWGRLLLSTLEELRRVKRVFTTR